MLTSSICKPISFTISYFNKATTSSTGYQQNTSQCNNLPHATGSNAIIPQQPITPSRGVITMIMEDRPLYVTNFCSFKSQLLMRKGVTLHIRQKRLKCNQCPHYIVGFLARKGGERSFFVLQLYSVEKHLPKQSYSWRFCVKSQAYMNKYRQSQLAVLFQIL